MAKVPPVGALAAAALMVRARLEPAAGGSSWTMAWWPIAVPEEGVPWGVGPVLALVSESSRRSY